jgi:hypothetical protein
MCIQRIGIVARMVIGVTSVCVCMLFEATIFGQAIKLQEVACIAVVMLASNLYRVGADRPAGESKSKDKFSQVPSRAFNEEGARLLGPGEEDVELAG